MVLLDLMLGVVAANVTGHADSLIISDFLLSSKYADLFYRCFFPTSVTKSPAGLKGQVVTSLTPSFPHGLGDSGICLYHLL